MTPPKETVEMLRNIQTEIGAGMVLLPTTDVERAYNIACERANKIVGSYAEGVGLFQLTKREGARG